MDVVSACPLRTASVVWQPRAGSFVMTVVCKATYQLAPVLSPLAPEQEYPNEEENHWNDDPARSLYAPGDLAPVKPRAEVMLVGHAFAPHGKRVRSLVARLIVGVVDKSVEVCADRSFALDGTLREGPPFTKLPLRYERAAGGPETSNPVGIHAEARDAYGATALPNLQPPGLLVSTPADSIAPIGFGPIAASWPPRRVKLGPLAATWSERTVSVYPLPEGFDRSFFMAAPSDQHLEALRADERLVLENLHPDHPRLVTNLAGIVPRATVERPGAAPRPLELAADTLWIDTDRALCTLTWRGQLPVEHAHEPGRVVVEMVERRRAPSPATAADDETTREGAKRAALGSFVANATASQPGAPAEPLSETQAPGLLTDASPEWLRSLRGVPAATASQPGAAPPPGPPSPRASEPGAVTPPPFVRPPVAAGPIAAASFETPWAARSDAPAKSRAPIVWPVRDAPAPSPSANGRATAPSGAVVRNAALPKDLSAAGASNAAAASSTATASNTEPAAAPAAGAGPVGRDATAARERLDLIWFDPGLAARLRRDAKVRELLAAAKPVDDAWLVGEPAPRDPDADRDRRDVVRFLARAEPIEPSHIDAALDASFDEEGCFAPRLAVVTGELAMRFDERETLRATITAVAPLLGTDKKLREIVGAASEALDAKWRLPDDVAEALTRRVEEAFRDTARTMPAGYLDRCVSKLLLEGRHYRKKQLMTEARIVAELVWPGSDAPVPAYLPGSIDARLPLFSRFRAAMIVEPRAREDQHEPHPAAFVVLALARSLKERRPATRLTERSTE